MNIKNILKYLLFGIQWGCTFFVAINIIVLLSIGEEAMLPTVLMDKCIKCGKCVTFCPKKALVLE